MKDIAHHRYTELTGPRIGIWVFAFGLAISLVGLSSFKNFDDALLELVPKNGVLYARSIGALALATIWTLLIALFARIFQWVLSWQTTAGWPRYFFYAFRFAEGEPIVGWTRIFFNASNRTLDALGKSFQASARLRTQECVTWTSDIVSGGTFRGHATCYVLYTLNEAEADKAKRPYRDGLLRFRQLQRADLIDGAPWPEPSRLGQDQYFGHQQAIDKDGLWNPAYAESVPVEGETDAEIVSWLNRELDVRRQSLLEALADVQKYLRNPKT